MNRIASNIPFDTPVLVFLYVQLITSYQIPETIARENKKCAAEVHLWTLPWGVDTLLGTCSSLLSYNPQASEEERDVILKLNSEEMKSLGHFNCNLTCILHFIYKNNEHATTSDQFNWLLTIPGIIWRLWRRLVSSDQSPTLLVNLNFIFSSYVDAPGERWQVLRSPNESWQSYKASPSVIGCHRDLAKFASFLKSARRGATFVMLNSNCQPDSECQCYMSSSWPHQVMTDGAEDSIIHRLK